MVQALRQCRGKQRRQWQREGEKSQWQREGEKFQWQREGEKSENREVWFGLLPPFGNQNARGSMSVTTSL